MRPPGLGMNQSSRYALRDVYAIDPGHLMNIFLDVELRERCCDVAWSGDEHRVSHPVSTRDSTAVSADERQRRLRHVVQSG